jgi:hypothetical protein
LKGNRGGPRLGLAVFANDTFHENRDSIFSDPAHTP